MVRCKAQEVFWNGAYTVRRSDAASQKEVLRGEADRVGNERRVILIAVLEKHSINLDQVCENLIIMKTVQICREKMTLKGRTLRKSIEKGISI